MCDESLSVVCDGELRPVSVDQFQPTAYVAKPDARLTSAKHVAEQDGGIPSDCVGYSIVHRRAGLISSDRYDDFGSRGTCVAVFESVFQRHDEQHGSHMVVCHSAGIYVCDDFYRCAHAHFHQPDIIRHKL